MKSGWTKSPDCIVDFIASANKETDVLTRHNEQLSSKTVLEAHQKVVVSPVAEAHSIVLLLQTGDIQARTASPCSYY